MRRGSLVMEINSLPINNQGTNLNFGTTSSEELPNSDNTMKKTDSPNLNQDKQQEIKPEKIEESVDEMNKAMQALHTNLHFKLHEKTGRLMVQIYDEDKQEVIKEFPPEKLLDTQAKIREYIGILLDMKG